MLRRMITRQAYRYVAAEVERRKKAGESAEVRVHLTSGETLIVDTVVSYGDEVRDWLMLRCTTDDEEDTTEFVPVEAVARVTVAASDPHHAPGFFTAEDHPPLESPPEH
jgi:hypothetical protein